MTMLADKYFQVRPDFRIELFGNDNSYSYGGRIFLTGTKILNNSLRLVENQYTFVYDIYQNSYKLRLCNDYDNYQTLDYFQTLIELKKFDVPDEIGDEFLELCNKARTNLTNKSTIAKKL